jgi:hypothetical protein
VKTMHAIAFRLALTIVGTIALAGLAPPPPTW